MATALMSNLTELTAEKVGELLRTGVGLHTAVLERWSVEEGAAEAASLANGEGGLLVAPGVPDAAKLLRAGAALQPFGPRLVRARVLENAVGVLAVREAGDVPVMVGREGAIYRRTSEGRVRVSKRAELDALIRKSARMRSRAESVINAQTDRTAFGHLNFLTIALIVTPLVAGSSSFGWTEGHLPALEQTRLGLAGGLKAAEAVTGRGLIEMRRDGDETGFITVAKNGTVTAGIHRMRPAQDRFVSAAELAGLVRDFAQAARTVTGGGDAGLVLPALFVQGLRNLRLEAVGGWGMPCSKDQQQTVLPHRFLETADDEEALAAGALDALGKLVSADLNKGVVEAFEGEVARTDAPKAWHGKTRRTERRLAFARRHGS